jgi:hypothetical protein
MNIGLDFDEPKKKFYCYVLLDPRKPGNYDYGLKAKFKHEPFYVGKGHGDRSDVHVRIAKLNRCHNHKEARIRKILADGYEVIVLRTKSLCTERHAFARERELVTTIGRRIDSKGPLTNLTCGGEGASGYVFTDSDRRVLKQAHIDNGRTRIVKYKGKKLTLEQLSEQIGVKAHTIQCRLLAGDSVEEAVRSVTPRDDYKSLTYKGVTKSLKEWSAYFGIKYATLFNRIQKGYPLSQVFTHNLIINRGQRKDAITISYKGRTQTLKAWCLEYNIKYTTAYARLLKGLAPHQILEQK